MGAALEKEFRIYLASDLPTATRVLTHETVDLLILNVHLGAESGLALLDHLRERSDIPVLLISGYGTKEKVIAGMQARACDYLDKPFTGKQLLDKVRALLASTDLSISEVATRVGFRDPQYFGRVFRRHCGLAPREYRAQQRHEA